MRFITVFLLILPLLISSVDSCLQNYHYRFISEWPEAGNWKTSAHIKPNFPYWLRNWEIRIEFNEPLATDMTTWITEGLKDTKGKHKVV